MTDRELLEVIATKVASLDEGQKNLVEGQKNLTVRMGTLEEGQKNLTGRMGTLEEGQKNLTARMGTLAEGQKNLTARMGTLEEGQKNLTDEVKKTNLIIENDIRPKIDALFDGYKQNTQKLDRIEAEVIKHEEFILKRIK